MSCPLCTCPLCSGPLRVQEGAKRLGEVTRRYGDCLRVCDACGIGLSNSITRPTYIRRNWKDGLWDPSSASRLQYLVAAALNKANRENKFRRLAHEHSEDMLVWNAFSWIEEYRLGCAAEFLGSAGCRGCPRLCYWGVNDRDAAWTGSFAKFLVDRFAESPDRQSEPDIIIETDDLVVFVEAKFTSPNDRGKGEKLDKYLSDSWVVNRLQLVAAGMYELVRNWAIGVAWANLGPRKRRFVLVNLVRESEETGIEDEFGALVRQGAAQTFRRVTWECLARRVCPELTERFRCLTTYCRPAFPSLGAAP